MGKLKADVCAQVDALVHGFAGYFHCELNAGASASSHDGFGKSSASASCHTVPGLSVSINPESYSEGMFSWQGNSDD